MHLNILLIRVQHKIIIKTDGTRKLNAITSVMPGPLVNNDYSLNYLTIELE